MDEHQKWTLDMLNALKNEQVAIFKKYQSRVINPDNTDEYKEAKTAFDQADRTIKAIDLDIAILLTEGEQEPDFLDAIWNKFKKLFKSDKWGSGGWSGVRG